MRPRAFVTCPVPADALRRLRRVATVDAWNGRVPIPRAQLLRGVARADGLLCLLTERIDAELLAHAPRLRVVANCAVGYDNVDLAATAERGIIVTNTPDVLTDTSADLAFALMLACARRVAEGDRMIRAGEWYGWSPDLLIGADVWGARLGIVGLGRIGSAVARRARGFDMRVLYAQRTRAETELGEYRELDGLLAEADVVTLHVPLTPDTHRLLDERRLALLRNGACLVNTARGEIVDQDALVAELVSGRIQAGLDVFVGEPDVPRELWSLPNVVLTPHLGSATKTAREGMTRLVVDNLLAVERGEPPPTPVNPSG